MTDDAPYRIEATGTSLRLLERLVEAGEPVGVTRLAADLDLSKSVAHNHLSTLRQLGYVVKRNREYEPTLRPLALGERTRRAMRVYDVGRERVDNLAEASGEVVLLFVEEANRGVPVCIAEGSGDWSPPYCVGERMPLHVNAPGRAILASLPEDRTASILGETPLGAPTDRTVTDRDELERRLRKVRDDGVAFCREEQFSGIIGVGAPIRETDGSRHAALGVVGPAERFNGRYLEEDLAGQVISTANAIEVALTE